MESSYYIGVDCGTTNVKAVLYNEVGVELHFTSRKNQVILHERYSEQDMEALWINVVMCLKELVIKSSVDTKRIRGLGVSGQGEGLWAIDGNGNPIGNAILWNDGRAIELIEELKANETQYRMIKRTVASYLKTGSTLTLIKWFYENQREKFKSIQTIFSCKDYIRYRLTGEIYWEYSDATCSCVNMETGNYATEVFHTLGIENALDKFPPLVSATKCCGYIIDHIAKEINLPKGIPVSGGLLDIVSTAAGLGVVNAGDVCVILGTTGMTLSVMDYYMADDYFNGWERHIDGKSYIKGMGSMAATPNLDWIISTIYSTEEVLNIYTKIEEEITDRMPGDTGLLYHPHISISGERAPFFQSKATVQIMGIRQDTEKIHLVQAAMEGVALSIKDCLKGVENCNKIYISGGGAKNKAWVQMIANALNAQIFITDGVELAAKGAALSALLMNCPALAMKEVTDGFSNVLETYKPEEKKVEAFDDLYQIYKQTQSSMEVFWEWRYNKMKEKIKI